MNNYLHKISIILIFLCFISFLLQNETFIGNTDLEEGFISEYKNVENKEYQKDSLNTKEDDNFRK